MVLGLDTILLLFEPLLHSFVVQLCVCRSDGLVSAQEDHRTRQTGALRQARIRLRSVEQVRQSRQMDEFGQTAHLSFLRLEK